MSKEVIVAHLTVGACSNSTVTNEERMSPALQKQVYVYSSTESKAHTFLATQAPLQGQH